MKDTGQKKKGTLKKLFSRLIGQYFGEHDGLKENILKRCSKFIQETPGVVEDSNKRGGHDDDGEAASSQSSSSFHRGHSSRQTTPPEVTRKPSSSEDDEIAQKGQFNSQKSGCRKASSQEKLQECADSSITAKMPVIRRALSPIDGIATDPGEVETTVYRSYTRRSRTAAGQNKSGGAVTKTAPLAAVCDDAILNKHGEDLVAAGALPKQPPIPPSKIPDFKLQLATQEPIVGGPKKVKGTKQKVINNGVKTSTQQRGINKEIPSTANTSAKQMDINKDTSSTANTSAKQRAINKDTGTASNATVLGGIPNKDSAFVSVNNRSSSKDKSKGTCQNERQPDICNQTKDLSNPVSDTSDRQTVNTQGNHVTIQNKGQINSLVSHNTSIDSNSANAQRTRIQNGQAKPQDKTNKRELSPGKHKVMGSNSTKGSPDTQNRKVVTVDQKAMGSTSESKPTKQKRQLPAIPQNVQPVLASDKTRRSSVSSCNQQSAPSVVNQSLPKPVKDQTNQNALVQSNRNANSEPKTHSQIPQTSGRSKTTQNQLVRNQDTPVGALGRKENHQTTPTPSLEARLKASDFKNTPYLPKSTNAPASSTKTENTPQMSKTVAKNTSISKGSVNTFKPKDTKSKEVDRPVESRSLGNHKSISAQTINKPTVNVSDTTASMIKQARSKTAIEKDDKTTVVDQVRVDSKPNSSDRATSNIFGQNAQMSCLVNQTRYQGKVPAESAKENTHIVDKSVKLKNAPEHENQVSKPKQQTLQNVTALPKEPATLNPRVDYTKKMHSEDGSKAKSKSQDLQGVRNVIPTQNGTTKRPDKSQESKDPVVPTKSGLTGTSNSDLSEPNPLTRVQREKHMDVNKSLSSKGKQRCIKTETNVNTFDVSVHNKMDYGHTVIVSQEVKIQNKEDKNTNNIPAKVNKEKNSLKHVGANERAKVIDQNKNNSTMKAKSQMKSDMPNVKETPTNPSDFLDISLTKLEEDFAKPLASSTLQRNSKAKNTIQSSNTSTLSNAQSDSQNNKTNESKEINDTPAPFSRNDNMRESIRLKRLQYFNSQASSNNQTVVINQNGVSVCTGDGPIKGQIITQLPQDCPSSNSTKGVIDSNINIHKGTAITSSNSNDNTKECNRVDINGPTTVSKQVGAALVSKEQRADSKTGINSGATKDIHKETKPNQDATIDQVHGRVGVKTPDISVINSDPNQILVISEDIHSHSNGGNIDHFATNRHQSIPDDSTIELENTITAHIDSTIVLPDDESLLETTLTVSHGNTDTITPTPFMFEENNMADVSSVSAHRNGILHYQLTIQDNCNGININVNRTSERPILDLMDVSHDGIQRLQLQDPSFVDSERSYAIHPEMMLTASTDTFASTIVDGGDEPQIPHLADNTTVLVNSDAFLHEDGLSDITCDTTYLMDADAWGHGLDDTIEHDTTHGMCDPVADPMHLNCRLRHIPLEGGQSTHVVASTSDNPISRNTPLRSSRGGYPWQRYRDLHHSRSNIFVPPWRSGASASASQNDVSSQPTTQTRNTQQSHENTQSVSDLRSQNERISGRSSSVLRTLVRPGSRRLSSTDSVQSLQLSTPNSASVTNALVTDSTTQASSVPIVNPSAREPISLPTSTVSESSMPSIATNSGAIVTTNNIPSLTTGNQNPYAISTTNSSSLSTSDIQTNVLSSRNTPEVTSVSSVAMTSATATSSQPIATQGLGFTNAIIEEVCDDSCDRSEPSGGKGKSKKNRNKGKSLTSKTATDKRPVARVFPRFRTVPTTSSSTAVSSQQPQPQTNPISSTTTNINSTPSLHISSTVSIGSTFSAFTPRSFPYNRNQYSNNRPASAIPSTQSISPLPASTLNTRSLTPAANSTMDLATRPVFDGYSRESLLSQDDNTSIGTVSSSTLDLIRAVNRRLPRSRDDTQLESGSDFVFVDEDVSDVSSRQTFRRFGLASTIQPSMRRARSGNSSGRRANNDSNGTDTLSNGRSLEETVAALRDDIVRVPGALILSIRRNRLVVYLSQDRPNVEGVVRFMQQNGISRADYEVEILPWGPNSRSPAQTLRARSSQVAS